MELYNSIRDGNLETVKYLVDEKGVDVNAKGPYVENTSLHDAAWYGYLDIVKYLVDEKGADVNIQNTCDKIPLHYASEKDDLDIVKILVQAGADVNTKDEMGKTPLHRAASCGRFDIVKYLVEKGANVNSRTFASETPYTMTLIYRYVDISKYLVERGAKINLSSVAMRFKTPFSIWVNNWDKEMTRMILLIRTIRTLPICRYVLRLELLPYCTESLSDNQIDICLQIAYDEKKVFDTKTKYINYIRKYIEWKSDDVIQPVLKKRRLV